MKTPGGLAASKMQSEEYLDLRIRMYFLSDMTWLISSNCCGSARGVGGGVRRDNVRFTTIIMA